MNCKEVLNKLTEYVEGTLPSAEREAMTSHFAACKSCHNALKERLAILKAMPLLAEMDPPAGFRADVMAAVREEASKQPTLSRWQRFARAWHPVRLAAAVLVLFLTIGYNIYPFMAAQTQQDMAQPELTIESVPPVKTLDDSNSAEQKKQADHVAIMAEEDSLQRAGEMFARAADTDEDNLPKRIIITTMGAGIAAVLAFTSRRKEAH